MNIAKQNNNLTTVSQNCVSSSKVLWEKLSANAETESASPQKIQTKPGVELCPVSSFLLLFELYSNL